jgi:hypothetical protein
MQGVLDFLGLMMWLLFALMIVGGPLFAYWKLRRRALRAEARAEEAEQELERTLSQLDTITRQHLERLRDYPQPLKNPPASIERILREVGAYHVDDPYAIPIGWQDTDGQPDLVTASLHGDSSYFVGNVMISAMTRWGKNILEFTITITMLLRNTPAQLQLFYVDGKGPDGNLMRGLAHNWHEPICTEEEIPSAIELLDQVRQERMALLARYEVTKWEELPPDVRPPLLWVVINEPTLFEKVLGKQFESWLEAQLASALAGGIRYCVVMQDASNWGTGWRRQIGLAIAGGQVSVEADKPNLGVSTKEIEERGAYPPSKLPERCWFTARMYREVISVSIAYLDVQYRKSLLARLPKKLMATAKLPASVPTGVSPTSEPSLGRDVPRTGVPAQPIQRQQPRFPGRLDGDGTEGTEGTAHQQAVQSRYDPEVEAEIESVLETGGTFTDRHIKYLHDIKAWSPSKIAASGGVRGQKQVRMDRICAVLGIPRPNTTRDAEIVESA